MNVLDVLKDIAAPAATIAAALAAASVTIAIQKQNFDLAKARLKLDLYNKRYEVYTAVRDLCILVSQNPDLEDEAVKDEMRRIHYKMSEAPLCCGPRAIAFCKEVFTAENVWRSARARLEVSKQMPQGPERVREVLALPNATGAMIGLQEHIVAAFAPDLRIDL